MNTRRTLRSARASATVDAESGGRLTSLIVDGVEVLADCSRPGSAHDWYRGSFVLAPWAGALPGGVLSFAGSRYSLATDANGDAKHGLVSERPWRFVSTSLKESTLAIDLGGVSDASGWPFEATVIQNYALTDTALHVRLEVHSKREPMPATAGFHPWFRSDINGRQPVISFEPARRVSVNAATGRIFFDAELGPRPWDEVFSGLDTPPRIAWPDGPALTLLSDAEVWVYYEQTPGGFCIEPWTAPPGALGTASAQAVLPGKPLTLGFTIDWES